MDLALLGQLNLSVGPVHKGRRTEPTGARLITSLVYQQCAKAGETTFY